MATRRLAKPRPVQGRQAPFETARLGAGYAAKMDGHPRQNPAYRPAKGKSLGDGAFSMDPRDSDTFDRCGSSSTQRRRPGLRGRSTAWTASASPLPGERDLNFRLRGRRRRLRPEVPPARRGPGRARARDRGARARRGVAEAPRLIRTPDGEAFGRSGDRAVSLLTWLEGRPWAECGPHGAERRESLGRAVARLDRALVGLSPPGREPPAPLEHGAGVRRGGVRRPRRAGATGGGARRSSSATRASSRRGSSGCRTR